MRAAPHHVSKPGLLAAALLFAGAAAAMPLLGKQRPGDVARGDGFAPPGRSAPEELPQGANEGRSAKDAARQAQSLNGGGRVLSVEEASGGWRVKLLKDGNVRFVFVPQ